MDINIEYTDLDRSYDTELPIKNFRDFLRKQIELKKKKNPAFSMRSFATVIGMTPGGLSRLLSGKMGLTVGRASEIAMHLKLTAKDREQFVTLVQYDRARNPRIKSQLHDQLKEKNVKFFDLNVDHFQTIANWFPLVVLRRVASPDAKRDTLSISQEFEKTQSEVAQVLERLERLELVKKVADQWERIPNTEIHVNFAQASEASRSLYGSIADEFKINLLKCEADERAVATNVFEFVPSQIPEVSLIFKDCLDRLRSLSEASPKNGKNLKEETKGLYQVLTTAFVLNGKKLSKWRKET